MKIVAKREDGTVVEIGDKLISFRGEEYTYTGCPQNGYNRVWVKSEKYPSMEFFPSVFDLELDEMEAL